MWCFLLLMNSRRTTRNSTDLPGLHEAKRQADHSHLTVPGRSNDHRRPGHAHAIIPVCSGAPGRLHAVRSPPRSRIRNRIAREALAAKPPRLSAVRGRWRSSLRRRWMKSAASPSVSGGLNIREILRQSRT
jgi:hypothetical protein